MISRAAIGVLGLGLMLAPDGRAQASGARPAQAPTAAQGTSAARRRVSGCYAFFDRRGRPAAESLYWAPATARLDSTGGAVKLTPEFDPGRRRPGPGAYRWWLDGRGDTLRALFHTGYSGTEFVLALRGESDTLRGRARQLWDAGPPFETDGGAVTAVRISCPPT